MPPYVSIEIHFPETNMRLVCLCPSHALQPCSRGDGDSRLEVHGGVSSSPGGRSLPLPGLSPVPFPRTPAQAPQTILTAWQQGVFTHALQTHAHTNTITHRFPPPPFLLSSGLVMSDIVLFSVCEVKSFGILLVPTLESVWKEETGHNNPKKS